MQQVIFQAYKWEHVQHDTEGFLIFIHGLTIKRERVTIKINDVKPFVYLELPANVTWTRHKLNCLYDYIDQVMKSHKPHKKAFVIRKKAYYLKSSKFVWLAFTNINSVKFLFNNFHDKKHNIYSIGLNLRFQVHEKKAAGLLQLYALTKLTPSGWIKAVSTIEHDEKFSKSDIELICSYKNISLEKGINDISDPLILSYDIECVSGDTSGSTFPNANNKNDKIICICATVAHMSDPPDEWKIYSLVNAENDRKCIQTPDGSTVRNYSDERNLLLGYTKLINEINPDVITGYNILRFDDNYMVIRSRINNCEKSFLRMSRLYCRNAYVPEPIKWKSSAYGMQEFNYIEIPGRLSLDLFPFVSKTYTTLQSYTLDSVAELYLQDHKVDLPAKEMMQIYYQGGQDNIEKIVTYCNKDTILPMRLMRKLNVWIDLIEMSNVVYVQMFDLLTHGQQIRVFSQIYILAYDLQIVCTQRWSDYNPSPEEKKFIGATVQNPRVGYWKLIPTYDFKSLYPTTVIGYNLCFSTAVPSNENPPPEDYHLIKIDSHQGCEHDTTVRKSKLPKDKHICKYEEFKFYKAHIKKGIVPQLLENLLAARAKTQAEIKNIQNQLKTVVNEKERSRLLFLLQVLDRRQNGFKVSANSAYGGFGSDYSELPYYPAAASTTAMGRYSIKMAIDFIQRYRPDMLLIYGDTDSCMIKFQNVKTLIECYNIAKDVEKQVNTIFPKPMYLELEKIYLKFFLLSKKRYIGYIVDPMTEQITLKDKKGVAIKRRDYCEYAKAIYSTMIDMVMDECLRWKVYDVLAIMIDDLLNKKIAMEKLIITKSIKESYKNENLAHLCVAKKMKERGKYVTTGTRIRYVFIKTDNKKDQQYKKSEDPDYCIEKKLELDYPYYLDKQIVKAIDEILLVNFHKDKVLANFVKLYKIGKINSAQEYFTAQFIIN